MGDNHHLTQINIAGVGLSIAAPVETWIMAMVSTMTPQEARALFYTVSQIEKQRESYYNVTEEFKGMTPQPGKEGDEDEQS